jgi:translation initiation factor IF-3
MLILTAEQITPYQAIRRHNSYLERLLAIAYHDWLFIPRESYTSQEQDFAIQRTQNLLEAGNECILVKDINENYVICYEDREVELIEEKSPASESAANLEGNVEAIGNQSQLAQKVDASHFISKETVTITVIAKQFRGSIYFQPSWDYNASIHQAKQLLKQERNVNLIVNIQGLKSIETTVAKQLFNQLVPEFQEEAEIKQILDLKEHHMIIQFSPKSSEELPTDNPQAITATDNNSSLEKTVALEVILKQFHGSSYLQQSSDYEASIQQAKQLLKQGNIVKLAISFHSQQNPETSLAEQFLNCLVEEFQEEAQVKPISELNNCQWFIQLTPEKRYSSGSKI